jgi:hypothetical protein
MSTTTVAGEIRLKRVSPEYWRVTFDLPPLNIFGPANIPQLEDVVSWIETDDQSRDRIADHVDCRAAHALKAIEAEN